MFLNKPLIRLLNCKIKNKRLFLRKKKVNNTIENKEKKFMKNQRRKILKKKKRKFLLKK